MRNSTRLKFSALSFFLLSPALSAFQYSGHVKGLSTYWSYPGDSVYFVQEGSDSLQSSIELRLNLDGKFTQNTALSWQLAYQYQLADQVFAIDKTGGINDRARLFDLTQSIHESENSYSLQRLDRINLGYTTEHWALRVGRQALSWGSGLMFSVMDIVNPFDGRIYDQEYKSGDDMLYLQYLQSNGNDIQFAQVYRRNPDTTARGKIYNTRAIKYHGFINSLEYDVLMSEHYGDNIFALGLGGPVYQAVAHMELRQTQTDKQNYFSGLVGVNYSWQAFEKNWTGLIEYYYDEAGLKGAFNLDKVYAQAYLAESAQRGEKFLFGREYLGVNTSIEMTPLWHTSAAMFFNMGDQSSLLQLSSNYDWRQNTQIFFALALPFGTPGSEFGGLEADINRQLSYDYSMQARLAWYF